LASNPRNTPASGGAVPLAEVDIRTSIRPTVATIDLGAIQRNFVRLRQMVGAGPAIWSVIKADAYGHGAVAVARALESLSSALAVSLVEEGLELRAAGVRAPIVVLGAAFNRHQNEVLEERLTPVVYDPGDLDRFAAAATKRGRPAAIHIKVDTGMSRLGVSTAELPALLDRVEELPGVTLAGLCTHFASADMPDSAPTDEALARFAPCLGLASRRWPGTLTNHAANTAAAVRFPKTRLDAIRPGLALYGTVPSPHVSVPGLEPALRLSTRIMATHEIDAGTAVSYGGIWRAARPSRIATLPLGYADGYPRHVHAAEVLVRGTRVPIVGVVCMDMFMIDVTDVPGAGVGDAVTLIGQDGAQRITVEDLAGWAGTVSYEILCGISKRVPRVYLNSSTTAPPSQPPASSP
jgi:alanine racemase